jgi:hypothetical protein
VEDLHRDDCPVALRWDDRCGPEDDSAPAVELGLVPSGHPARHFDDHVDPVTLPGGCQGDSVVKGLHRDDCPVVLHWDDHRRLAALLADRCGRADRFQVGFEPALSHRDADLPLACRFAQAGCPRGGFVLVFPRPGAVYFLVHPCRRVQFG